MRRVALVVGIDRYPWLKDAKGKTQNLTFPAQDAEAIARLLRECGHFEVKLLPVTLANGANQVDARGTVAETDLQAAISELFHPSEGEVPQTALLFFAGHGLLQPLPRQKSKGYLAASNTSPEQGRWGISFEWLRDELIESAVPEQVVWLDCCYSGEFTNLIFAQADAENRGQTKVSRSLIAACRDFEAAQGFDGHGLLTSLLLRGLHPEQNPAGKWITSKNLDAFINDGLLNDPKLSTFQQRFRTNAPGEPIYFWQTLGTKVQATETAVAFSPIPTQVKKVVGIETMQAVPVWAGRDELLKQLGAKLLLPGTEANQSAKLPKVLVLVGQGGIGKSSLAVKLLEAVGVDLTAATLVDSSPYQRVICFRAEAGNSFDEVAKAILDGLGIEVNAQAEASQKIRQILAGLTQARCLLVLDNLEVILHPASHPQAGRAIASDWGKLLYALGANNHCSQAILTSREIPADLGNRQSLQAVFDSALVHIETLLGVDVAAGIEILQLRQLQDSQSDLRWIAERVGGHAFLLAQLANLGKDKPGYLRQHPELVTQNAEPILQAQLARQSQEAQDLLRRMCVLRVGINLRGLTSLRLYSDGKKNFWDLSVSNLFRKPVCKQPHELTAGEIQQTKLIVERLVESSLVQSRYDEPTGEYLYSLHRLIVEFLQGTYQTEVPNLLKSVYAFYQVGKQVKDPKNLADLQPVLEAQYFAFQLGNYREAANLIMYNLENYLKPWGYWSLLKDLYEQILPYVDEENRDRWLQRIGGIYRDTGEWDLAEKYFQEALEIAQKQESKSGMATSWAMLGDIERNRGNWDEAERLYRQSLAVRTELGDRSGMAATWASLGNIERNRGNWDEAERLYRQSLAVRTELGDRSGMAATWASLGNIERNRGNWDEAERLYRQCLAVETELGDRAGMAGTWASLGNIERNRGNWDEAERLYRQSLAVETELGDRAGMAGTWASLGGIEGNRGNWDEAERLYRQSLAVRTELGDRSGMAGTWASLGNIERNRGNWDEAERLYRQCLAVETELGDRAGMAGTWASLGNIERNRGNWDEAERLYRQCLAVETELGDRSGMAGTWASLGNIERNRGNWDEAERLYRQSLAVETELGDRAGMAGTWASLGGIEGNRGNWDEAERLYRQSLAVETELGDRAGMAGTWASLGGIERNRGNWDEAERLYRQCLAVETELGDRAGMAGTWASLGGIERNRGNWDEAECLYRQSLAVETELGDRAGMAGTWASLGGIERNRGNWDEAERLYRQCLAVETELGDRAGMAALIGCLGEIEMLRGNFDAAELLMKEALTKMQELGMTLYIAETNYDLARLERRRGNTQQAQQHYDTAHQIFQQLGAAKDLERIESEWNV